MKILFIHDDCQTVGGANIYRRELCRIMKPLGHDMCLYTMKPNFEEAELSHYYTIKKRSPLIDHFRRRYFNLSLFLDLKRAIKETNPDIVHIHGNDLFCNSVLMACGAIPVVQTLHDWKTICPIWNGVTVNGVICEKSFSAACHKEGCISRGRYFSQRIWRKFNLYLIKTRINTLIAPSMALNRALTNYGLESVYIPNYVDTSKYRPSPTGPNGTRVLCVCQLYLSKGVDHLVRAFQKVLMKIPSATLDIAGNGPERKRLEKLCVSMKIQNSVKFHGMVKHVDLTALYSKASVMVLPSVVAENCPLVVLEAMASGRAVIGSRIGGIPDLVVENETGLLYNPRDTIELSEKIVRLLSDPERAEIMGRSGRKCVEREFSAENHIRRLLEVYHNHKNKV